MTPSCFLASDLTSEALQTIEIVIREFIEDMALASMSSDQPALSARCLEIAVILVIFCDRFFH